MGTLGTAGACILFALINPRATYWAFGFPATVLSVFGVDFVFTAGTLYNAKISLPHEQSLAAALFQTMVQVCIFAWLLMYVTYASFNLSSSGHLQGSRYRPLSLIA